MSKGVFSVGDRVVCTEPVGFDMFPTSGHRGTVVEVLDGYCGVEFDEPFIGHSCHNTSKDLRGWFVGNEDLRKEEGNDK